MENITVFKGTTSKFSALGKGNIDSARKAGKKWVKNIKVAKQKRPQSKLEIVRKRVEQSKKQLKSVKECDGDYFDPSEGTSATMSESEFSLDSERYDLNHCMVLPVETIGLLPVEKTPCLDDDMALEEDRFTHNAAHLRANFETDQMSICSPKKFILAPTKKMLKQKSTKSERVLKRINSISKRMTEHKNVEIGA